MLSQNLKYRSVVKHHNPFKSILFAPAVKLSPAASFYRSKLRLKYAGIFLYYVAGVGLISHTQPISQRVFHTLSGTAGRNQRMQIGADLKL